MSSAIVSLLALDNLKRTSSITTGILWLDVIICLLYIIALLYIISITLYSIKSKILAIISRIQFKRTLSKYIKERAKEYYNFYE